MVFNFNNTYSTLSPKLYSKVLPEKILNPKILILNENLFKELYLKKSKDLVDILSGNKTIQTPIAQAYCGHQFGYFAVLGDGRALLLGEHITKNKRFDIQLKGSGETPYSRGGDGKATISSVLREYLYSYALTQLGIKSSRSLAVILTNEPVFRENTEEGGILVRVMQSHIRFGTFEYVRLLNSKKELKKFVDYVIQRHYSTLINDENKYLKLFELVMENLISMVINWYRVGFIHGVMNTDNMSITGETFDYGPCSFMNSYDLETTFSQVDTTKRYSFGNQKSILNWNLARFAETLIPLIDEDSKVAVNKLTNILNTFNEKFDREFYIMMASKLGIKNVSNNIQLINEFLEWLKESKADYTNTFIELLEENSFNDKEFKSKTFLELRKQIKKVGLEPKIMKKTNPQVILRNYLVEDALNDYVEKKDLSKFNELLLALEKPYEKVIDLKFQIPPSKNYDKKYRTHCNT